MNVHIFVFVYMWKKHWTVKGGYNERSLDKNINTETGEF